MARKRDGLDAYRRLRNTGLDDRQSEAIVDLLGIERREVLTISELDDALSSFERRFTINLIIGQLLYVAFVVMLVKWL